MTRGTDKTELLSVEEMYRADAFAMKQGTAGIVLMENAGAAIARAIRNRRPPGCVAVLCGPGNNGGDGFVVARHLALVGWDVRLGLLGEVSDLKGDAAAMAARWDGDILPLTEDLVDGCDLVVDALFGAGLARDLSGVPLALADMCTGRKIPVVAVDVPSGVDGNTGAVRGGAFEAGLTVTFFRRKTGHLLLPGRLLCGETIVADIGIPHDALGEIRPGAFANHPNLWLADFPWPRANGHKYGRGHAVVMSGPMSATGAARLGAYAALRAGAGLVTVASPPDALMVNAAHLTAVMLRRVADLEAWNDLLADKRLNAILLGPGNGVTENTKARVLAALAAGKSCVLDADALTVFQDDPSALFKAVKSPCVLTPHDGEFGRLFDTDGDKLTRVRASAEKSGAVVLLKGPDTVIAAPDGRAAINENAPPDLATAGAGDVLAGIIVGLMAAGMPPFEAACAGAWLHGESANVIGHGLIAEDLSDALTTVLGVLRGDYPLP